MYGHIYSSKVLPLRPGMGQCMVMHTVQSFSLQSLEWVSVWSYIQFKVSPFKAWNGSVYGHTYSSKVLPSKPGVGQCMSIHTVQRFSLQSLEWVSVWLSQCLQQQFENCLLQKFRSHKYLNFRDQRTFLTVAKLEVFPEFISSGCVVSFSIQMAMLCLYSVLPFRWLYVLSVLSSTIQIAVLCLRSVLCHSDSCALFA